MPWVEMDVGRGHLHFYQLRAVAVPVLLSSSWAQGSVLPTRPGTAVYSLLLNGSFMQHPRPPPEGKGTWKGQGPVVRGPWAPSVSDSNPSMHHANPPPPLPNPVVWAEKLICSRFSLGQCNLEVRFSHTNLHFLPFPVLFEVVCF